MGNSLSGQKSRGPFGVGTTRESDGRRPVNTAVRNVVSEANPSYSGEGYTTISASHANAASAMIARVQLYGEILTSISQGASLGMHAFLTVKTNVEHVVVEMYGPQGSTKGRPQVNAFHAVNSFRRGRNLIATITNAIASPPNPPTDPFKFENGIIRFARYFKSHPEVLPNYKAYGPNSNGYIRALVELAGGRISMPTKKIFGSNRAGFVGHRNIASYERALEKKFGPLVNAKEDPKRAKAPPLSPKMHIDLRHLAKPW